jgi:outer membrane protein assembly factor BamD
MSGCGVFGDKKKQSLEEELKSAESLYQDGMAQMELKNYESAIEIFETLESRYPFGDYAQQAQLQIAYAYYRQDEPDATIAAADQFMKLNPRHQHLDYAIYLKGLADFHRHDSFTDKFINRNIAAMDPEPLQNAFTQFKQIVENYPQSRYAKDSRQRMVYLRNLLAEHELSVAKFYQRRRAWAAVADRAAYVVEHYQGADNIEEALTILADAYAHLGLQQAREETLKVLSLNFPAEPEKN